MVCFIVLTLLSGTYWVSLAFPIWVCLSEGWSATPPRRVARQLCLAVGRQLRLVDLLGRRVVDNSASLFRSAGGLAGRLVSHL
jgi:hypothetical protein